MEIFTDDWVDVKKMNDKYPDTFDIPTQNELENITIGDSIKISNGFERFWVEIKNINELYLIGRVDNKLITSEYNLNDYVMFENRNIYNINNIKYKKNIIKNIKKNKDKILYKIKNNK